MRYTVLKTIIYQCTYLTTCECIFPQIKGINSGWSFCNYLVWKMAKTWCCQPSLSAWIVLEYSITKLVANRSNCIWNISRRYNHLNNISFERFRITLNLHPDKTIRLPRSKIVPNLQKFFLIVLKNDLIHNIWKAANVGGGEWSLHGIHASKDFQRHNKNVVLEITINFEITSIA